MRYMDNLLGLLDSTVQKTPEREAVVDSRVRLTYGDLWKQIVSLSTLMLELGVFPGDRIGILMQNSAEFIVSLYSTYAVGGIAVPIDADINAYNLKYQLNNAKTVLLLSQEKYIRQLRNIVVDIATLRLIIICDEHILSKPDKKFPVEVIKWEKEIRNIGRPPIPKLIKTAQLIHTTGTTGMSKAVVLTHEQMKITAQNIINITELTKADKEVTALPLVRLYGQYHIYCYHQVGGCIIIDKGLNYFKNPGRILDRIIEERATSFPHVSSAFIFFMNNYSERFKKCDIWLRYIMICSMPITAREIERLQNHLPTTNIINTYGLSEAARSTYVNVTKYPNKSSSVGRPVAGGKVLIVNEEGVEVTRGAKGEIVLQMPHSFSGYWNNQKETDRVLRKDGLYTGDIGYLDDDGFLYYCGRLKDLINVGGRKFNPIEIENELEILEQVKKAVVVAVADPRGVLGELPFAFVVLNDGEVIDERDLREKLMDKVEKYKIPRVFQFIKSIPCTSSGKVLRRELREKAEDYFNHTLKEKQ